jgi:hypothetical protein
MDAQVTIPAGTGTYYVRIDGVGSGDPVNTGYSDYASVGEYVLAISNCDGSMPAVTTPATPTSPTTNTTTTAVGAPGAPGIGRATSGRRGHPVTATARWSAPAGSAGIVGYRVRAERVDSSGRVVKVFSSQLLSAATRTVSLRLGKGHYRFRVVAYNHAGSSPMSAPSRIVRAR